MSRVWGLAWRFDLGSHSVPQFSVPWDATQVLEATNCDINLLFLTKISPKGAQFAGVTHRGRRACTRPQAAHVFCPQTRRTHPPIHPSCTHGAHSEVVFALDQLFNILNWLMSQGCQGTGVG